MNDAPSAFIPQHFLRSDADQKNIEDDWNTPAASDFVDKLVDEFYASGGKKYSIAPDETVESGADVFIEMPLSSIRSRDCLTLVERKRLLELVQKFKESQDFEIGIDKDTAAAARAFFRMLPSSVPPPRVAPDSEGSLLVIWGGREDVHLLMVLDSWNVHLVAAPGTIDAKYIENMKLQPDELPTDLLNRLFAAG